MQILVNTDNQVESGPALVELVEGEVNANLGRFDAQITRVEVHLSDLNHAKGGKRDKHCTMEARLKGHQPVVVSQDDASFEQAVSAAATKLERALDHTIGRMTDAQRRATIRTEEVVSESGLNEL